MFPILDISLFSEKVSLILDKINRVSFSGMLSTDTVSSVDYENHLFIMYDFQSAPLVDGEYYLRLYYKPRKLSFYWNGESSYRGLFSSDYIDKKEFVDILNKCLSSI